MSPGDMINDKRTLRVWFFMNHPLVCEITDFFASIVSIENKLNSMDKNYIEIKKVGGIARREKKMKSEPVCTPYHEI